MPYFADFFKRNQIHPKLIEADQVLLQHVEQLRQRAEILSSRDKEGANFLLNHAVGLCDAVLEGATNSLKNNAKALKNLCLKDIDREPSSYTSLADFTTNYS